MAEEQALAETPVVEVPATPNTPETPVNLDDGIVDLDAQPEVQQREEESEGEQPEGGKDADAKTEEAKAEEKKKLSGAQRAKLREQRLAAENAELQRKLEEATRKTPANDAGADEKPPREEDFNGDWFAYQRALTAWDAGKAVRDEIRKDREARESSERETKQAQIARERHTAHLERVEAAREVIADFDEVMKGMDGVSVRHDVIEEIMASDKSAEISYYLATNPDKLSALNSMSGRELARQMGRLEATVKLPEARKQTSAPAPLSRPKGGTAPPSQEARLQAWLKKQYG